MEQYIYNACTSLKEYNIESRILCTSKTVKKRSTYLFNDIEVIAYPETFNISSCPISAQYLLNFCKEAQWADVIFFHYPWPFADALPLILKKKKPKIAIYHSDIVKQKLLKIILRPLDKLFLSKMNKIVSTSEQYASSSKNLIKYSKKVEVIPICLDKKLYPKPQKSECSKIQKQFGNKFFLFVGQLRYYKGLHLLLEAIKDINTPLLIIGQGPLEKKIRMLIDKHSINNVHLIGPVNDQIKVNYINSCYSVILPSHLRSEAFGISLLEGCMLGKPLISCKIGTGTEYINKHNFNGLVAQPNAKSIREAIKHLLNNPELAKAMGKNSSQRFKSHFSIDLLGKKLHSIINPLVTTK